MVLMDAPNHSLSAALSAALAAADLTEPALFTPGQRVRSLDAEDDDALGTVVATNPLRTAAQVAWDCGSTTWPSPRSIAALDAPVPCPCGQPALTEQLANDRWVVGCGHCATFVDFADTDHATVDDARDAWECEVALYAEWVAAGGLIDVGPSTPLRNSGGVV